MVVGLLWFKQCLQKMVTHRPNLHYLNMKALQIAGEKLTQISSFSCADRFAGDVFCNQKAPSLKIGSDRDAVCWDCCSSKYASIDGVACSI